MLEGLNPPQHEAVIHQGSPLLVVAGAGSGKTRVLTRRIAYLIAACGVHPGSILAITFTNKAATEMRERVGDLVGPRARHMWVSTFHSACVRMLRADIDKLGMSKTFSIYDATDSKRLVTTIMHERNIDPKRFQPRAVRSWISEQKNALVSADDALIATQGKYPEEVYSEVYTEYQARLVKAQALDFDDLLMTTVRLLQKFPEVRQHYRRRFRHVLVDEYQDTNRAQYVMVKLLCGVEPGEVGPPPELMVVGDSDQSIYAFRGASIENILNFQEDFPGAATIALEQNYRSTQNILSAANALIGHNQGRPKKNLWTDAGDGPKIIGYVADTEHDEARFIADELASLSDRGEARYGDAAVFYRTNAQSRTIEDVFIRLGVPYRVVGGVKFYERREVRDAIAYLRALANPADDVSVERIINVPKRGIGATSEEALRQWARGHDLTLTQAIEQAEQIPTVGPRARKPLIQFAELMAQHRAMVEQRAPADEILRSILDQSGYLESLRNSGDPQDETRMENLAELVAVATEFVSAAHEIDVTPEAATHDDDPLADSAQDWLARPTSPDGEVGGGTGDRPDQPALTEAALIGAPEPDDSLPAFLERIALVADSDQLQSDQAGQGAVTLMTLHTAKGLEFDTVFVTGFEEGLFPHERSSTDPAQLEEERRLAYVGLTRARHRLYISRAVVRTMWGSPKYNPPSRFLEEIPEAVIDWRRLDRVSSWQASSLPTADTRHSTRGGGSVEQFVHRATTARPKVRVTLAAGDKVLHSQWGLGTVKAMSEAKNGPVAEVDFGSYGVKKVAVNFAPLEKL
ncbi:MAG: UvrD-helicase domain-containing protein [Propionibacteriaceae bacterium]|nr:UvrD-helicase domain-containing protein [Propionibacteriaceae bacterium]